MILMFPPLPLPSDLDGSSSDTDSTCSSLLSPQSAPLPETPIRIGSYRYSSAADTLLSRRGLQPQVQRTDQSEYVVLDSSRTSVSLLSPHSGLHAYAHVHSMVSSFSAPLPNSSSTVVSGSASSPHAHVSKPTSAPQANGNVHLQLKLTEQTLQFNLKTLNLHLSLRVREVLACAEAMWDFVVDYQRQQTDTSASAPAARVPSQFARSTSSLAESEYDSVHVALMNMMREEFDELLTRFEL